MQKILEMILLIFSLILMIGNVRAGASWEDLAHGIAEKLMNKYGRTIEGQEKYQQYKSTLRERNMTLVDHVKQVIFGYDGQSQVPNYQLFKMRINNEGDVTVYIQTSTPKDHPWLTLQLLQQNVVLGLSSNEGFILLAVNHFPYDLQEGIEHWIVWSSIEINLSDVRDFLSIIIGQGYETMPYINELHHKSIPEIFHAQVFLRKSPVQVQNVQL